MKASEGMLQGQSLKDTVELFQKRGVRLYHACQLVDFQSYLHLNGIPSRALLESEELSYTKFDSDNDDRTNKVWDKVFGNLSDFGSTFGGGNAATPTAYGPILFQVRPEALNESTDLAICLRSASGKNFDREAESFSSVEEVDRLFKHPIGHRGSGWLKTKEELQKEFSIPKASLPEFSCTVESEKIPLNYVELIRVDSYVIQGKSLYDWVEQLATDSGQNFRIYIRDRCPSFTNELAEILAITHDIPTLSDLCHSSNTSDELKAWARAIIAGGLEYQFERFATYLIDGTLKPMLRGSLT